MMCDSLINSNNLGGNVAYPEEMIHGVKHFFVPCRKRVKGWEGSEGEGFFVVADINELEERFQPKASPDREDVEAELMIFRLQSDKPAGEGARPTEETIQNAVSKLVK